MSEDDDENVSNPIMWSSAGQSLEIFDVYDKNKYLESEKWKNLNIEIMSHADIVEAFLEGAEFGRLENLKLLLNTSIGLSLIYAKDMDYYTALHRASYNNHVEIIKFLLDKGADIQAKTIDGWSPLHCACKWENVNVVEFLLEKNADVNAISNSGQTPLHLAALNRRQDKILKLLLKHPLIDVNKRNSLNMLPYDIALQMGAFSTVFKNYN